MGRLKRCLRSKLCWRPKHGERISRTQNIDAAERTYIALRAVSFRAKARWNAPDVSSRPNAVPEVRARLRDDDHGAFATDPKHWPKKEDCYYTEYKKLERQFWDRSRPDRFNREEVTLSDAMNRDPFWKSKILARLKRISNPGCIGNLFIDMKRRD